MIKFVMRKIMIKYKKKLTYTKAMEKQDQLWITQDENLDIMIALHKSIIAEAKENGWNGLAESYIYDNSEVVTHFYYDRIDKANNENYYFSCVTCKDLKKALEREINIDWYNTVGELGLLKG